MIKVIIIILIIICAFYVVNLKTENFTNVNYYNIESKNALNRHFDIVYIITLPKRREYIKNIMEKLNIDYEIFDAKLKDKLDKKKLKKHNFIAKNYKGNDGRIACHLSHMSVMNKFINSNYNNCFIFEDDLKEPEITLDEMNHIVDNAMMNVPFSYDLIYFGRCWDKCDKQINVKNGLVRTFFPLCRHAYGVSRNGAQTLLEKAKPMKIGGGDKLIANLIEKGELESYAITPPLFHQNRESLGSTLANNDSMRECRTVKKIKKNIIEHFGENEDNTKKSNNFYDKIHDYFNPHESLILTTYFCKTKDKHHEKYAPCNDIDYIGNWYYSMKTHNLYGIVFYDSCSQEFIDTYQTSKIKFIKTDSQNFNYTLNDQRFFLYEDYIKKNKNIKKIFMTDGNDVTIVNNPFNFINNNDIYIGTEEETIKDKLDWFKKKCINKDLKNSLDKNKFEIILNAGIIGGTRENILDLLGKMNKMFKNYADKECDINMQVLNVVGYDDLKNKKISKKLNSKFKHYQHYRDDVYFIHK
jgi:GR25 family glycosyltransferase involved in LPS biosynthesis